MIIKKKLTQMGHDVVLTVHGQDAVDTFKQDPAFDIVLMDLQVSVNPASSYAAALTAHATDASSGWLGRHSLDPSARRRGRSARQPIAKVARRLWTHTNPGGIGFA